MAAPAGVASFGLARGRAAMSLRRETAICAGALTLLAVVALGWYVVHGGFYWDDWENAATTRYRYEAGFIGPFDLRQLLYRPVLQLLIPLVHVVLGANPALHLALAALLAVAVSTCFYVLLRTLRVAPLHAGAIAALALLFPWSDSSRLWATASLNNVAVCLFLAGLTAAVCELREPDAERARQLRRRSLVLYVLGVLTYNVAGLATLAAVVVYLLVAPRERAFARWRTDLKWVGPAILFVTVFSTKKANGPVAAVEHGARMVAQAAAVASRALWPFGALPPAAGVALCAAIVTAAAVLVRRLPRECPRRAALRRWLTIAGVAFAGIVAAYAIFVPADPKYSPLAPGIYNRVSTLAGLGFAALVYALVALVATLALPRGWRAARLTLLFALAGLLAAGWGMRMGDHERAYARASTLQEHVLATMRRELPHPPHGAVVLTFHQPLMSAPGVPVFGEGWDLSAAAKVSWNRPSFSAYPVPPQVPLACRPGGAVLADPVRYAGHPPRLLYGRLYLADLAAGRVFQVTSPASCEAAVADIRG